MLIASCPARRTASGDAAGAHPPAGLASETPGAWWERSRGDLRPELADILGPARHPAGRLFHYSNPGYGLLGALVGQLRGHGWEEALRQEILGPLGMARTTVSPEPPHARGFAVHPWADVMQLEPAEGTGLMAPAGELWSTAADLCRFAAFLLDGDDRILPAKTLTEMRTPVAPPRDDAWQVCWVQPSTSRYVWPSPHSAWKCGIPVAIKGTSPALLTAR
jgi:CubicO group peptidase (beta-lactamase class C family)